MKEGDDEPIISGRMRGPGPGRYGIPFTVGFRKHDPTKQMNPAYSFGMKLEQLPRMKAPGPSYFIDSRVTRVGNNGAAVYSIQGKQKDLTFFHVPGPGTYANEKVPPVNEPRAPVYTMGSRTRYRRCDPSPAPDRYSLHSMLGPNIPNKLSYPSYSTTAQSKVGHYAYDWAKSPGPGQHDMPSVNIYLQQFPIYSLLARQPPIDKYKKSPGPGAHQPEKVTINYPKAPSYYMGIRHSEFVTPLVVDVKN
ncbi:outer dense fiber protein 3-like [Polyodon spathula]|uniref:outer dense fiber protein 3-like n=1 Tax=Polyodon spathula TaxID=7913 RepID=UPI001B7D92BA|nr:outer dense fiber protein 3-like [Polyodon spathula]